MEIDLFPFEAIRNQHLPSRSRSEKPGRPKQLIYSSFPLLLHHLYPGVFNLSSDRDL